MIRLSSGPALSARSGALRRRLLFVYGRPWLGPARRLLQPGLTAYTALPHRPVARRVADQIANSRRRGFGLALAGGADCCDFRYRPLNPRGSP